MEPDFDWSLFGLQVAGNVIWAAACFVTGAAAASVTSAPTYISNATTRINDVDRYLQGRVGPVINILRTAGGLPDVDAPAIQATVQQLLLIEANATPPKRGDALTMAMGNLRPTMIREAATGYLLYSYKVGNIKHDQGFFHHDTMNDVWAWRVGSGASVALVPSANTGDVNTSMNAAQLNLKGEDMHIASWPCKKAINLYSDKPGEPDVLVRFNEANGLTGVSGWGVVHDYLTDHDQLAFRGAHRHRMWGGLVPPDVAKLSAPPELLESAGDMPR